VCDDDDDDDDGCCNDVCRYVFSVSAGAGVCVMMMMMIDDVTMSTGMYSLYQPVLECVCV